MFQIVVVRLLRAVLAYIARAWVAHFPNLRMSIRELHAETVVMTVGGDGWKIVPYPGSRVGDEETIVNTALILIQQNPEFRRLSKISLAGEKLDVIAGARWNRSQRGIASAHKGVHRIA